MGGKVQGHRLLITVTEQEHRQIAKAAKRDSLPVATYIRRAALFAARAAITPKTIAPACAEGETPTPEGGR